VSIRSTLVPGAARVVRVNGPLVEVEGLDAVAVLDMLEIGYLRLAAEVISVRPGRVTAQVYEYTGGLSVGEPARCRHQPLAARLGPHLMGSTFDGLLRPLSGLPVWLAPGAVDRQLARTWRFLPRCESGSPAKAGTVLGSVATDTILEHRVLVPPAYLDPSTGFPAPVR
jgi:V/A-type H+-transporting ATPase subunit A